jgi:hypothetical protein
MPMPRRLDLAGAILRLGVFFGAGTSVFAGERLAALVFNRVVPFG